MKRLAERAGEFLGMSLDPRRYLVVGNARFKRSVFLFQPGGDRPALLARLPTNDEAQTQCRTEYEALEFLAGRSIRRLRSPSPLGAIELDGHPVFLQEVIVSRQMLGSLPLWSKKPKRWHFQRATDHLIDIYAGTRSAGNAEGKSYAPCYQHGDFWIGNLGVSGESLVLYDFEYARESGLPLHDLLQFALYYQVVMSNVGKVGPAAVSGDRTADGRQFSPTAIGAATVFLGRGTLARLVRACISRYVEACRIDAGEARELVRSYVEVDRGIDEMPSGWFREVLP